MVADSSSCDTPRVLTASFDCTTKPASIDNLPPLESPPNGGKGPEYGVFLILFFLKDGQWSTKQYDTTQTIASLSRLAEMTTFRAMQLRQGILV